MLCPRLRGVGRLLLRAFSVLALSIGMFAQDSPPWPVDAPEFRIHMIGNSHVDPVWLWPWPEGFSVVNSTFRSALERMNETPGFAFTASSAQYYEWVAENDPALLAEIRRRIAEGRWDPVGGWWVEPDVNLPSGEALIRQGLYGQLTFRHLLGRTATVAYNPDSFGHAGTLPQILKLQGMDNYVFMRPKPEEKKLPADLFWWQSPDGTRVLTYRIPVEYGDDKSVRKRVWHIVAEQKKSTKDLMAFYGAGDHGGGATKANIQSIHEIQSDGLAPKISFSTPDRYFAEIRKQPPSNLPVVQDDLQHHSVGCYTAESEMKKNNRASEIALVSAEKLAAIGSLAWGAQYPKTDFTSAWKKVLFLQFHDSLAGTALPEHYQTTAREGYGLAQSVAHSALYAAAEKLAWQVPTEDPDSQYLVAFNLEPWPVTAHLEYDLEWPTNDPARVEDEHGAPISHQWVHATTEVTERKRLVFQTTLPAFGYRQIRIRRGGAGVPSQVHADSQVLENEHLKVTFAPDGSLQIFNKDENHEIFTNQLTGARAVVLNDPSDTWSHGVRTYDKQIGQFANAQTTLIENGPLRGRVRVRSTFDKSTLTIDWILYAGARTLEARVSLDWHEHLRMLKFSFPVNVNEPRSTYEIAYGNIVRPVNGDENPGQRWLDVTDAAEKGDYGLTVVNDAKYGYSVLGNDMRISVTRGAAYANHQPKVLEPNIEHLWQDQGVQTFRMLLVPHSGGWREATIPRTAEEFMSPMPIIFQGIHPGSRPQSASFLSVNGPSIVISAIKKSESGDDLILRCYEANGQPTTASIDFRYSGLHWSGHFHPYEIKTIRMNTMTYLIREVNALEE
jgi:alpha-mannosidase